MFGLYNRLGVHVCDSDMTVIREVRLRLSPLAFTRKHREDRHQIYRTILQEHAEARKLYYYVLGAV